MPSRGRIVPIGLGVISQAVASVTTLLASMLVLRGTGLQEFGVYSVALGLAQLYAGLASSFVLTEMGIRAAEISAESARQLAERTLVASILLVGVSIAIVTAIASLVPISSSTIWATTIAGVGALGREFFQKLLFALSEERAVLVCHAVGSIITFCILGFAFALDKIDASLSLFALGLGYLTATTVGIYLAGLRVPNIRHCRPASLSHVGAWSTAGVLIAWFQSQVHIYVTMMTLNTVAIGLVSAARLFVAPALALLPAVSQILTPRLARLQAAGASAESLAYKTSGVLIIFSVTYVALLVPALSRIAPLLGDLDVDTLAPLVIGWGCFLVVLNARVAIATLLQVRRMFRQIAMINSVTVIVGACLAYIACVLYGPIGAVAGTAISEAMLCVLLLGIARRRSIK